MLAVGGAVRVARSEDAHPCPRLPARAWLARHRARAAPVQDGAQAAAAQRVPSGAGTAGMEGGARGLVGWVARAVEWAPECPRPERAVEPQRCPSLPSFLAASFTSDRQRAPVGLRGRTPERPRECDARLLPFHRPHLDGLLPRPDAAQRDRARRAATQHDADAD